MEIDLQQTPILGDLPAKFRQKLSALAQRRIIPAGEIVFAEDDPTSQLFLLVSGHCMLSQNAEPLGEARKGELLDEVATLGGVSHTVRAMTMSECRFLVWDVAELWAQSEFAEIARRYLATTLLETQSRLAEVTSPIHYLGDGAQLPPGPFVFKNVTLIIALCDADLDPVRERLPDGLSLFRPAWRKRDSLFLAAADFPNAFPDHRPQSRFGYTETTYFAPVRYRGKVGLITPYIYPSAYEPILLGREIYGFPKQLGQTTFTPNSVSLQVDRVNFFDFTYSQTESAGEPRLVRALSDWMGIPGRVVETAFRIGDTLLDVMRIPLYRRVSVYNHKRIPAVDSTIDSPAYDVNILTRAIFSVTQWHHIARIVDGKLTMYSGPIRNANLHEAYITRLDMRLSTGRVLRDYHK